MKTRKCHPHLACFSYLALVLPFKSYRTKRTRWFLSFQIYLTFQDTQLLWGVAVRAHNARPQEASLIHRVSSDSPRATVDKTNHLLYVFVWSRRPRMNFSRFVKLVVVFSFPLSLSKGEYCGGVAPWPGSVSCLWPLLCLRPVHTTPLCTLQVLMSILKHCDILSMEEDLLILQDHCRDPAISVRKQALQSLTELVMVRSITLCVYRMLSVLQQKQFWVGFNGEPC